MDKCCDYKYLLIIKKKQSTHIRLVTLVKKKLISALPVRRTHTEHIRSAMIHSKEQSEAETFDWGRVCQQTFSKQRGEICTNLNACLTSLQSKTPRSVIGGSDRILVVDNIIQGSLLFGEC